MKARCFKQQNAIFAKDQKEYLQLPAHCDTENGTATFSFKLSEEEIKQVIETGTVYLTVLTFNQPLQPIAQSFLNPFVK
jgi:hypothetical protein